MTTLNKDDMPQEKQEKQKDSSKQESLQTAQAQPKVDHPP